jgi:ATPase subunit of ABC transporter with duplicated ATPase domains
MSHALKSRLILRIGSKIKFGNLTQEHEDLPNNENLFDYIFKNTKTPENEIYNSLKHFGFDQQVIKEPINKLSPGQKTRLVLAMFTLKNINTLILDEPTNHLDIEALIAIENSLKNYLGTVILISHDRYLIEEINPDIIFEFNKEGFNRIHSI